jgi:arylsulfatase A-like enzyme
MKASGLGAAALALPGRPGTGRVQGDRPNILWLVSEDNSPLLGCYGDDYAATPNPDRLAKESVVFDNAFANAPVCAPARCTIHTGMYASSLGTLHMRSMNPIPGDVKFFTEQLREAGYYCVNGNKTDYNTTGTPKGAWDDRKFSATLKGLDKRQPFFRFINYTVSHESSLHKTNPLEHDPAKVRLAPYHPDTPELRRDYAQYYDQVTKLDGRIGQALAELDEAGLSEDTIVFYFSDHGGILPRSKKFLYDTGMRVPMIVRFPEKYRHLAPGKPGTRVDRLVSFVDLAPTILSLAGLPIPGHMQGRPFMGEETAPGPDYVYGFLGRIDERYDMSRAVVDKRFQYIRNYMPHYPWGRHMDYLWMMPAMQSWEAEYKAGRLNEIQSRHFGPKPMEELYDLQADPYEVNNLADDSGYQETLLRMREANRKFLMDIRDTGFIHEAEIAVRSEGSTPFEMARDKTRYDLLRLMEAADAANRRDPGETAALIELLNDHDSGVRYWGAVGCAALGKEADAAADTLVKALNDSSPSVRVAAAEALCLLGTCDKALPSLEKALSHPNMWVGLHAVDALYNIDAKTGPVMEAKKRAALRKVRRKTTLNAIR